jgi:D-alanyl-D-alanine carboxypeptidase (penicillin-binding protein 5/6)
VQAPVVKGQKLGEIVIECDGAVLARVPIVAAAGVEKLTWWDVFKKLMGLLTMSARA